LQRKEEAVVEAALTYRLEDTFRKERGRLLGFIRSRIPNWHEAEDVLQDVFSQAVENLNAAQPVDNLLAWLYRVTRNRIIDLYRRKESKPLAIDDDWSLDELISDSGIDIEKDFIREQVMEAVLDALEELPENQREVFLRQAVEGRTFREISEQTGISVNTLLSRKRYAQRFLRKRLEDIKDLIQELK
jgi:RNA polymerase sigma factor (sigma-70 family)